MIAKICRQFVPSVVAIGMCIFAGSVMAFDLGGALKQVQQAVKQQEPAPSQSPPAPIQQPQVSPQGETGTAQNTPSNQTNSGTTRYKPQGQSTGDFLKESKQREQKENETLAVKKEKAMVPDFVETTTPLEIKGIKIGMSLKELLAIFPQGKVVNTVQNTEDWVNGDVHVIYSDPALRCDYKFASDPKCKKFTLLGKEPFGAVMNFLSGKLVCVEIMFQRNGVKDPYTATFYDEMLAALQEKFKAESKSKDTELPGKTRIHKVSMRVAGWNNSSTKDSIELQDNGSFTFSNGRDDDYFLIRMKSEIYTDAINKRLDMVNGFVAREEAKKEQRIKQDL